MPFYHRMHRTLADYLDALLAAGLRLARLLDVDHPDAAGGRAAGRPPRAPGLPSYGAARAAAR